MFIFHRTCPQCASCCISGRPKVRCPADMLKGLWAYPPSIPYITQAAFRMDEKAVVAKGGTGEKFPDACLFFTSLLPQRSCKLSYTHKHTLQRYYIIYMLFLSAFTSSCTFSLPCIPNFVFAYHHIQFYRHSTTEFLPGFCDILHHVQSGSLKLRLNLNSYGFLN